MRDARLCLYVLDSKSSDMNSSQPRARVAHARAQSFRSGWSRTAREGRLQARLFYSGTGETFPAA